MYFRPICSVQPCATYHTSSGRAPQQRQSLCQDVTPYPPQLLSGTNPRSAAELLLEDVPKFRQLPCRTYISVGTCPYRERCVYLHDPRLMSRDAKTKTRRKNKEDIVQDSLFWPALTFREVTHRLDGNRQPHVIQRYGVPCPQGNQYRRHDQAVYSMWMHFVTFCNQESTGGNNQYECDAEMAPFVHPAYLHPSRVAASPLAARGCTSNDFNSPRTPQIRQQGIFMEETLSVNPFINVERLNVFKTLALGQAVQSNGDGKEKMKYASAISTSSRIYNSAPVPGFAAQGQRTSSLYVDTRFPAESPQASPRSTTSFFPSGVPSRDEQRQTPGGCYEKPMFSPRPYQQFNKPIEADEDRKKMLRIYGITVPTTPYYDDLSAYSPDARTPDSHNREILLQHPTPSRGSWLRTPSAQGQAIPFMSHNRAVQMNISGRDGSQVDGFACASVTSSCFEDRNRNLGSLFQPDQPSMFMNVFEREMAQARESVQELYPEEESLLSSNFFDDESPADRHCSSTPVGEHTIVLPRQKHFSFSAKDNDSSMYRSDALKVHLSYTDSFSSPRDPTLPLNVPVTPPFNAFNMDLASPTTVSDISRNSPLHALQKILKHDVAFENTLTHTRKINPELLPPTVWATLDIKSRSNSVVDNAYSSFSKNIGDTECTSLDSRSMDCFGPLISYNSVCPSPK